MEGGEVYIGENLGFTFEGKGTRAILDSSPTNLNSKTFHNSRETSLPEGSNHSERGKGDGRLGSTFSSLSDNVERSHAPRTSMRTAPARVVQIERDVGGR